ncbi:MAG: hypothetical protein B6241_07290 [Spirochaetaceae bacterium 4572_59]|nr:MAG: hypothetical protein B6241_07290 [Spirochaetaceae bacterium 4572_59]
MSNFYKKGLQFSCTQCGHCCRHDPGYVFLSEADVRQAFEFLSLPEEEFLKKYCRIVDVGFFKKVSLQEKSNYDCIFWQDGVGCAIYEARPLQCRSYPFWPAIMDSEESWVEEAKQCPGMNRGEVHSEKAIESWLGRMEREKPYKP